MFAQTLTGYTSKKIKLIGLLLALSTPVQADALLDDMVEFGGQVLHLQTKVPGLVIGVVHKGETSVMGFGETRRGNGIQPTGDTVLRVGSLTKVFTGEMLAHAVAKGEASFVDQVAPLLDGKLGAAAAKHPPIRLIDLATHSAGLPREVPRPAGNDDNPFGTITYEAFAQWLEQNTLQFAPGSSISYSNFGFDLLSAALASAGGRPYSELLEERITGPLNMKDTRFEPDASMKTRLMSGHAPDGSPVAEVPSGKVIEGSGGLRTTTNDLVKWMKWHLDTNGPDADVRFLDHAVYIQRDGKDMVLSMDESGRMDAMGLGWIAMNKTNEHPFVLQKSGALQGQMSYLAFAPEHETAVFMTINQLDFSADYAMSSFVNDLLSELCGY